MARRVGLTGSGDALDPQLNELRLTLPPRTFADGAVNVGLQPELRIAVDWVFCHNANIA
jgi:hypothetical protein